MNIKLNWALYYLQKARMTDNEQDKKNYILIAENQIRKYANTLI